MLFDVGEEAEDLRPEAGQEHGVAEEVFFIAQHLPPLPALHLHLPTRTSGHDEAEVGPMHLNIKIIINIIIILLQGEENRKMNLLRGSPGFAESFATSGQHPIPRAVANAQIRLVIVILQMGVRKEQCLSQILW